MQGSRGVGPRLPDDPGMDFLVGAENQMGAGDMEAVLPTGDLRVVSSDPTPGDAVGYAVQLRGNKVGSHTVRSEMTASLIPGVTVERDQVTVTPRG